MARGHAIRPYRGLKANLPTTNSPSNIQALDGEILLATDTNELFRGRSDGATEPIKIDYPNVLNAPSGTLPSTTAGDAGRFLAVNAAGTGYELVTLTIDGGTF